MEQNTKYCKSITLRSLKKVHKALQDENKPVSADFISRKCGIHHYAVKIALDELIKTSRAKELQSSRGTLYIGMNLADDFSIKIIEGGENGTMGKPEKKTT